MKIAGTIKGQREFWPGPYPGTTQAGGDQEVAEERMDFNFLRTFRLTTRTCSHLLDS